MRRHIPMPFRRLEYLSAMHQWKCAYASDWEGQARVGVETTRELKANRSTKKRWLAAPLRQGLRTGPPDCRPVWTGVVESSQDVPTPHR